MRLVFCRRFLWTLLLVVPCLISPKPVAAQAQHMVTAQDQEVDPDIADSEFNHHLVGCALIAIALLMAASQRFPKLRSLQAIWPFLFLAAGLFLAAWSDREIWPRGFLSWTWLIHHDAEARQHKIFAVLLIILSALEYLRWRQRLTRFWETWAFPALAVLGATLLLFHSHAGSSGLPRGWEQFTKAQKAAYVASQSHEPQATGVRGGVKGAVVSNGSPTVHDHAGHQHMVNMKDMADMTVDLAEVQSSPSSDGGAMTHHGGGGHEGHTMTPAMLRIKQQHLWFTIVGLAVAFLKFSADGRVWRVRFVPYLWPSAMAVLGVLLIMYKE